MTSPSNLTADSPARLPDEQTIRLAAHYRNGSGVPGDQRHPAPEGSA